MVNKSRRLKTVTVIMPTYRQDWGLPRALSSLRSQSYHEWELIAILDGRTTTARDIIRREGNSRRTTIIANHHNGGLGAALNQGIAAASGDFIAFLPSDDCWYPDHLQRLMDTLHGSRNLVAYSGFWSNRARTGWCGLTLAGGAMAQNLQMGANTLDSGPFASHAANLMKIVQVAGPRDAFLGKWIEREEAVSDLLEYDYWRRLEVAGWTFRSTGAITCEWVDHPDQHHKILIEPSQPRPGLGANSGRGPSAYRAYYDVNIQEPLTWRPGTAAEQRDTGRPSSPTATVSAGRDDDPLRILLVGDLGYNPDRIAALTERGHRLWGLWSPDLEAWNTGATPALAACPSIDPTDPRWPERVGDISPDVAYALLNFRSIPLIHRFVHDFPDIPTVFHFKESPYEAIKWGLQVKLAEIFERASAVIHISGVAANWYEHAFPTLRRHTGRHVMDGDQPSALWFTEERSPRLSDSDGAVHTVCVGRPVGLEAPDTFLRSGIHLHLYGEQFRSSETLRSNQAAWVAAGLETGFLHLHPTVEPAAWTRELSRYDAGWLHGSAASAVYGIPGLFGWDSLNLPARIGTYAAAGLPWLLRGASSGRSSVEEIGDSTAVLLKADHDEDLAELLLNVETMESARQAMNAARRRFTFDANIAQLTAIFRSSL